VETLRRIQATRRIIRMLVLLFSPCDSKLFCILLTEIDILFDYHQRWSLPERVATANQSSPRMVHTSVWLTELFDRSWSLYQCSGSWNGTIFMQTIFARQVAANAYASARTWSFHLRFLLGNTSSLQFQMQYWRRCTNAIQ
jgi:hypothetical protein